jgi:proteasome lid subunit RPN8/RPN11
MILRLPETLAAEIRRAGETAYPAEGCGILAGYVDVGIDSDGGTKVVVRLVPAVNGRTDDPHRYLIAAEDLRRIEGELRRQGLDIIGYYHSHPDHPAVPSVFDTEHAWPWYSYIIVRVDRGRGTELSSWVLDDDRAAMRAESVEVFSEV